MLDVGVQVLTHRETGQSCRVLQDDSLDGSGWTPESLRFLLELVTQLPAEGVSEVAQLAEVWVSRAELDRLARDLGKGCETE